MSCQDASKDTERLLEELLLMARSGQLIGIAFVGLLPERQFTSGWAGEAAEDPVFTIGALGHLSHDLIVEIERSTDKEKCAP